MPLHYTVFFSFRGTIATILSPFAERANRPAFGVNVDAVTREASGERLPDVCQVILDSRARFAAFVSLRSHGMYVENT